MRLRVCAECKARGRGVCVLNGMQREGDFERLGEVDVQLEKSSRGTTDKVNVDHHTLPA